MPETNFEIPIIRNSSPYITEENLAQKLQEERKKYGTFKSYFGVASTGLTKGNFIPNYVTITPSEPPILHKFRDENRENWIGEQNWKK